MVFIPNLNIRKTEVQGIKLSSKLPKSKTTLNLADSFNQIAPFPLNNFIQELPCNIFGYVLKEYPNSSAVKRGSNEQTI